MAYEQSGRLDEPRAERGWPRWLAAFLSGVLLLLALLIIAWFMRACAPVEPSANLTALETPAPPAPPPPPDPTPTLKASLDEAQADEKTLKAELAAVTAELKHKLAQCKVAEAPKPVPPPPPPPQPKPAPLPADRWAQKDLGMLQGCWVLGHDTQGNIGVGNRSELCAVKAGRICFGANGGGERTTLAICPGAGTVRCSAPVSARFGNDNTLGTSQPAVRCQPASVGWNGPPNSMSCRRINDALAICRDRLNFEHEFRRQ
jgi:hypothetical protein